MTREPLADVKFRKPREITKHGFPKDSRGSESSTFSGMKYCNMALLHEQNTRRCGMSVSDKSASDAGIAAMSQVLSRK
jgi:hypothetical protein